MEKKKTEGKSRPPIIAVLGHVDHGKTTLLDNIRKSSVAVREAGGITQSIGASVVSTKEGKKITFIDTPGHAAFSNMRSRGAKVADIAILVVAANDGVKPQTKEAISFIQQADISIIVAVTKIDLPAIDVESVKDQLAKEGISVEGKGGKVPVVAVSGKTGEGVDELLEIISLVAEISEIKAQQDAPLEAVIIETDKDKRGMLATAVVRNGCLKVADEIVAEGVETKVRGLFDFEGKPVKFVLPGDPVQILGFSVLPPVGAKITLADPSRADQTTLKSHTRDIPTVSEDQVPVIVKASSTGSLEAILANIPDGIVVIHSGIGDVTENDIFLAKTSVNAKIVAFEAKVPTSVNKLADTEGIQVETFSIIYELFDKLEEYLKAKNEDVLGKAQILATFPFSGKTVAGCKVTEGKISKGGNFIIKRGKKELGRVKAISLKREKKDISEAKPGEELGILFDKKLDFEVGDVVLSVR